MAKKKQEVMFKGVTKQGQMFFTPNFEGAVFNSTIDPVPVNRKSNRAMLKIIQGMGNDQAQEELKANRLQKEKGKRKASKKRSYLSRRTNKIRRRAS